MWKCRRDAINSARGGGMWFWVSIGFPWEGGDCITRFSQWGPRAGGSAPGSSPPGAGEAASSLRSSAKWLAPPSGDGMTPHRTQTRRHHHTQKLGPVCFRKHGLDLFVMLSRNVFLHKDRKAVAWLTNGKAEYYIWCWGIPWAVQWLGVCVLLLHKGWVWPLVWGELRSHMPHGAAKKKKKKNKLVVEINIELHLKAVC